MKVAAATLTSVVVERPVPTTAAPQHLCRDKGFDYPETRATATAQGYTVHKRGLDTPPPPAGQRFLGRGTHQ